MYVVSAASGNTGSVVARQLLAKNVPTRVIVRDSEQENAWSALGAEVALGTLRDQEFLVRALQNATGMYLLIPSDWTSGSIQLYQKELVDVFFEAIQKSSLSHLVFLSSLGISEQHAPIKALQYAETRLETLSKTRVTFLRAAYFMENLKSSVAPVQKNGVLPAFFSKNLSIPMVATKDVGNVAVSALLAPEKYAQIQQIIGPRVYSYQQIASLLESGLQAKIQVLSTPQTALLPVFMSMGMPKDVAEFWTVFYQNIEEKRFVVDANYPVLQGNTPLEALFSQWYA